MRSLVSGLHSVVRGRLRRRDLFRGLAALSLAGGDAAARPGPRLDRSRRSRLADHVGGRVGPALASDGETVVVGSRDGSVASAVGGREAARTAVDSRGGAAAVFARRGGGWVRQATLAPAAAGVQFGSAVAVDGRTALVGDPFGEPDEEGAPGVVWVFRRQGDGWERATRLVSPEPGGVDRFGTAVALDGGTALVGASAAASAAGERSGSVSVFTREGGDWTREDTLSSEAPTTGRIGTTVALDDGTAVVGGERRTDDGSRAGMALLFERRAGRWTGPARLTPETGDVDGFGAALSVGSGAVLVGAPGAAAGSGAAYLFTRQGGVWARRRRLRPVVDGGLRRFGTAVAVDADRAVVAAAADHRWDGARAGHGAAHLFARRGGRCRRRGIVPVGDETPTEQFGATAALAGDGVLVGTREPGAGSGRGTGATYLVETE